jgi:serine protease Do
MDKKYAGAALAALTVLLGGAGTETQAQQIARETPIVKAVKKTRDGIVTIHAARRHDYGTTKDVVGTGVIVDEHGYAITNRHVVLGADRLSVTLADGTELAATLHASDSKYDLAILKLPGNRKYHELRFGPGSDLLVGETVIAVGNPLGYTNTVTTGIISAIGREVEVNEVMLKNIIQHSASINPGNSGGPLLNINGELIGINVAMRTGAQNIAFALNADSVQQALSQHLSATRLSKLSHGLSVKETIEGESLERQRVVVEKVAAKSAAATAGLKSGDVLVKMAGRSVSNRFDVERALWDSKAGDKVEAVVLRDGRPTPMELALDKGDAVRVASADAPAGKSFAELAQAAGNR